MNDSLLSLHKLVWTSLLAATIAAGAFLVVHIGPVPVSMQPFFVFLAGFVLGPVRGAVCVLLYLAAGTIGLPVFAGGKSGLAHLIGPTGGYLFGFVLSALLTGMATSGKRNLNWLTGMAWGILGLLAVYTTGVGWLKFAISVDWTKALVIGCYPFIGWDLLKIVAAVACCRLLNRYKLLTWLEQ
jgi:biotin transport system substrate-specific component